MTLFAAALRVRQLLTPGNPAAGENSLYPKADNRWYSKDSAGAESLVGPEGGITQAAADTRYLNVEGDTMEGGLDMAGNDVYDVQNLSITGTPSAPDHAATKGYVDAEILDLHDNPNLAVEEEGSTAIGAVRFINFKGTGVTAVGVAQGRVEVTVPGGGGGGETIPVGCIQMWLTATPPTNWLICDGGTFVAATYPALYTLLGNSNVLPDLKNRFPVGVGSVFAIGSTDGEVEASRTTAHTHAPGTLATPQGGTHAHPIDGQATGADNVASGTARFAPPSGHAHGGTTTGNPLHSHIVSQGATALSLQTGANHTVPFYSLNFIIKAA